MDDEKELYRKLVDVLPSLNGPVKATLITADHAHTIYLHPSVYKGYYYIAVINGIENILRPNKRPVKIESIENYLSMIGITIDCIEVNLESSRLYEYSPYETMQNKENKKLVYFIECAGRIKIGVAENPKSRLIKLQTGSPHKMKLLAVCRGGYEKEKALHKRFSHLRENGEWFKETQELLYFIKHLPYPKPINSDPIPF